MSSLHQLIIEINAFKRSFFTAGITTKQERNNHITTMSIRSPTSILQMLNLTALGGMTMYFKSHHDYNLQEHEARMDELEGTLRGHIGLIEDALERLEGQKMDGKSDKA